MNAETTTQPPAQPDVPEVLPSAPDEYPGAFGLYKYSRAAVRVNINTIAIIALLLIVLEVVIGVFKINSFVVQVIDYVLSAAASASFTLAIIGGVRRQKLSTKQVLSNSKPFILKMIGLTLLTSAIIFGSLLLLIVPFFFVFPRLALVNYYLIDQKLGVFEAVNASWKTTKGYAVRIWAITGATFLMVLLVLTIIGIPFSLYFLIMYSAVFAVLYEYILKHPAPPEPTNQAAQPVA